MDAAGLRKRLIQSLLEDINDVQFPSVTMMDRVESSPASEERISPTDSGAISSIAKSAVIWYSRARETSDRRAPDQTAARQMQRPPRSGRARPH
jgi:hypothetical protein